MTGRLQKDCIGFEFVLKFKTRDPDDACLFTTVDIPTATGLSLEVRKPSGALVSLPGLLYGDGTDGKMKYTTVAGDLDEVGNYEMQGAAVIGGWNGRSDKHRFMVLSNV